jgi:hypothetical protein
MQKLNTLWQIVNAASTVRDIAQHTRSYNFAVSGPVTFYLRTENADVYVFRWARPMIEVMTKLHGAFGWEVAADQDEAGVYVAARRRSVVGGLSSARFEVRVPADTYLILNLQGGSLNLGSIDGTLHIPPPGEDGVTTLGGGSY